MKSKAILAGIILLVISFLGLQYFPSGEDTIKVASFNAQIFGDTKISKIGVDYYKDLIEDYDLFFLLEIRDIDQSSFQQVCDSLTNYNCLISNRSGRSTSKEQIGVFYKNESLNIIEFKSLTDNEDKFEREPVFLKLDNGLIFHIVHLKPTNVSQELTALEELVTTGVLIGDFNADCDYYNNEEEIHLDSWNWIIKDDADTTTTKTDCAYDRIIVANSIEVSDFGIVEIDEDVSDHKLIWAEITG